MVASGAQVVALATAEKMGTAETYIVAQLHELDILITDAEADLDTLQLFKNKGIEIW
jgi:DeoR/GlpR family transcriptional regulator of sugar metabolism